MLVMMMMVVMMVVMMLTMIMVMILVPFHFWHILQHPGPWQILPPPGGLQPSSNVPDDGDDGGDDGDDVDDVDNDDDNGIVPFLARIRCLLLEDYGHH